MGNRETIKSTNPHNNMPRSRRSAARPSARRAPPSRSSSTALRRAPPSTPARPTTTPSQSQGGMLSGVGSTIAQGMAFGTGSAIAHRAVGAVANSFSGSNEQPAQVENVQPMEQYASLNTNEPCVQDKKIYFDCLKQNNGNQASCSFLYDVLKSCQNSESQM